MSTAAARTNEIFIVDCSFAHPLPHCHCKNLLRCPHGIAVATHGMQSELFVDERRGCADMSPRRLWRAIIPRHNAASNVSSAVVALVAVGRWLHAEVAAIIVDFCRRLFYRSVTS